MLDQGELAHSRIGLAQIHLSQLRQPHHQSRRQWRPASIVRVDRPELTLQEFPIHVRPSGWHTTRKLRPPANVTLVPLPPACPELNPAENVWQYLRQTYLANRVFATYTDILDACQDAWRKLLA